MKHGQGQNQTSDGRVLIKNHLCLSVLSAAGVLQASAWFRGYANSSLIASNFSTQQKKEAR